MHETYLQHAIDLAIQNVILKQGGPYAAIVVQREQILAASGNQVTQTNDPTAHAEIMAIRLACQKLNRFQLTDCILYTSCEPCPMCLGAIYWARLGQVYFAANREDAAHAQFDDRFIYDQIALMPAQRSIPMLQLNLPNKLQPFIQWLENEDRINY